MGARAGIAVDRHDAKWLNIVAEFEPRWLRRVGRWVERRSHAARSRAAAHGWHASRAHLVERLEGVGREKGFDCCPLEGIRGVLMLAHKCVTAPG